MKLMHNQILIVMLILLAFTGQAIASTAMSYAAVSCVHESMTTEVSMMGHEAMTHEAMGNEDSANMMLADSKMDCCQEQCKCPMNGCVSISLLINSYFNSEIIAEQKISQSLSQHKSQINSSLYRPPIS